MEVQLKEQTDNKKWLIEVIFQIVEGGRAVAIHKQR